MPDSSTGQSNPFASGNDENLAQNSAGDLRADSVRQATDQREDLRGDLPPEPPVQPINPFLADDSHQKLPDRDEEEHYKDQLKDPEPVNDQEPVVADVAPNDQPMNPFDANAFGDKPLDQVEEKEPEEIHHAVEKEQHDGESGEIHVSEEKTEQRANVIDVEPESGEIVSESSFDSALEEASEPEQFKQEFWDILHHAGINKKVIIWIVVGLLMGVAAFLFLIFGVSNWLKDDGGTEVDVVAEEPSEEQPVDQPVKPVESGGGKVVASPDGVVNAFIFGLEYNPIEVRPIGQFGDLAGVESAIDFGLESGANAENYVNYFELLRKMENSFNTDIYALLNQSVDRQKAFDGYVVDLKDLIAMAEAGVADLDNMMNYLAGEYDAAILQRDTFEQQFFSDVDVLHGEAAQSSMEAFTEYSKSAVGIKAQFNAYSVVRDLLVNDLSYLRPRLEDVVSNEDALLKGIQVFDVPGSNIDAIVPIEN